MIEAPGTLSCVDATTPVNPKLCVPPPHGPPARVLSPLFFPAKSLLLPKPCGNKEHPKTTWSSFFSSKTAWSSHSTAAAPRFKSQRQSSSAAPHPTPPTITYTCQHSLSFQIYWAALVSLGRCGPKAWSQSSPSSHIGAVTWGRCLPVIFWVEVTPIPLAQSMATAI